MRICIVTRGFSLSWGGAERVAVHLSEKLAAGGHEVQVLTAMADTRPPGVNLKILSVSRLFSPWKILSFQHKVEAELRAGRFDLVYGLCQVYPVDVYRVGGGIHRHWMRLQHPNPALRKIKYLTSLVHLAMTWIEGRIFANGNCRFFVTNSRLVKDQITAYFGIPAEKIRVIYNGVDHSLFNPSVRSVRTSMRRRLNVGDDEFVILFAANNWERKGLATIIEAIPRSGLAGLRLVVVGRGKTSAFASLARRLGLPSGTVIFVGHTRDIAPYYGMADAFVLPSRYEPFANVCLEAMACGLPVVTTSTNGASELLEEGVNGFTLRDWRDSEGLALVLRRIATEGILGGLGTEAQRTASRFTWEKYLEETMSLFQELEGTCTPQERVSSVRA